MDQSNLLVLAMAERCLEILNRKPADDRFALQAPLRPEHLRWMCKTLTEHAEDWPATKSHRWLGFVQAGLIANLVLDLDGAKRMFGAIKETYGPATKDQDLLDHLNPSASFEMDIGGQG
jgi:hypothetical protein